MQMIGYRQGINNLRQELNKLGEQTELLCQAVSDLQSEADLMQGLEEQLSEIARKQGVNANEIVMLVRENEAVLSKQKANLKVSLWWIPYHLCVDFITFWSNTYLHSSSKLL